MKDYTVEAHGNLNVARLSIRQYYAAKAMQGIMANPNDTDMSPSETAEMSFKYADAMLKVEE